MFDCFFGVQSRKLMLMAAIVLFCRPAAAATLLWDFAIDEQQVKNGPEVDGSTNSDATGTGQVIYDTETNTISYTIQWQNLFADLTKLHIHGPADAETSNPQHILEIFGPPEIPGSVSLRGDTWTNSHQLTTLIQPGFDPLEPADVIQIMQSGQAYINVHTAVFGMGEIRGNLGTPVPEPGALSLLLVAVAGFSSTAKGRFL